MENKNLFTSEDKPKAVPQRSVYLALIAENLERHGIAHYSGEFINVPKKLSTEYFKFFGAYQKIFETCLRKFDGKSTDKFTSEYKREVKKTCEEETAKLVKEILEYIVDKVAYRNKYLQFNIYENVHVHNNIRSMLKEKANEQHISKILDLPNYILDEIERKLKKIARSALVEDALEEAARRANLLGRFNYRKPMESIDDIFNHLIVNNSDPDYSMENLCNNLSTFVNESYNKFRIVGNTNYLIYPPDYKSALYTNFKRKVEKYLEKED